MAKNFFFFSSRRRHTRLQGDWSSDVCSSDLFQTGLVFANSKPKPSLQAFKLPFAEEGRVEFQKTLWGQVRGAQPGRKPYQLEILHRSTWQAVGRPQMTNAQGVFVRSIRLKRGALLRVFSPRQDRFSQQVRVR